MQSDDAAKRLSSDARAFVDRGAAFLERRELEAARTELERARELTPDDPRAQNLLGLVYFKLGLLESARAIYGRLVDKFPREPSLYVNLGLVLLRQGRLTEAERALRSAVDLSPRHRRAHAYLGLVLYRRGDLQMAHDHFVLGQANDFAKKVETKLSRVGGALPTQAELLSAVAADGIDGLVGDTKPFQPVDAITDARVVRDEEAWEAIVTHGLEQKNRIDASSREVVAVLDPEVPMPSDAPSTDVFANDHTPRVNTLGSRPSRSASDEPWQSDGYTPAPAAWPKQRTGFDMSTSGISSMSPSLATPSLIPSELPSVVTNGGLSPTADLPRAPTADALPAVMGGRPGSMTSTMESPPAAIAGFVAGPGARARLGLSGTAYLRASSIVAASGRLSMREALSTSGDDPICVLEGHAVLHLRVSRFAVALRDARDLFVVKGGVVGFDDGFDWDHSVSMGMEVLTLSGTGTMLFDTRGPPMLLPVSAGRPVHAASDAVLAWSREVDPSALSRGEGRARLLQFRGRGYVLVAFPPDEEPGPEGTRG